jgi:hypothetical protein
MNHCDGCTICCTLFKVEWLDKPKNTSCIHCDAGCLIEDIKPEECTSFNCAYIQSNIDNINLRPDNSNVVFEKLSDRIFLGTLVPNTKPSKSAVNQTHNFIDQGYSVVLSLDSEIKFMCGSNNVNDIKAEFNEILNGNL